MSSSTGTHRVDVLMSQIEPQHDQSHSLFANVPKAPADPILGMRTLFLADSNPNKINVSIGAYRTDEGKPYVLKCVREAEKRILDANLDKEYLPQRGNDKFSALARSVLLGNDAACIKENRVVTIQGLSGSGSLRIVAAFLHRFMKDPYVLYSNPTWSSHSSICAAENIQSSSYRYWDAKKRCLDLDGMLEDLNNAKPGTVVILHACAHNPTGVDPTQAQWEQIAKVMKEKKLVPWFDSAYQGFASGDLDRDAWALRYFEKQGFEMFICQSFAKNFGLYGERVGTMNLILPPGSPSTLIEPILSQLDVIVRNLYSNPPLQGARIVQTILEDDALRQMWYDEMRIMSNRIIDMRKALREAIEKLGTPGTWNHITDQIGMFSYTGLTPKQSEAMISKHHIYLLRSGRISMAGVTSKNVQAIANAIHDVVVNVRD